LLISGVCLALTWPRRLCLFRVLLGAMPLLKVFPSRSTLGEVALHLPCLAGVFISSSHGKCSFPSLQWGFPHTATFTNLPAPRLLGRRHHSCLLWPACLFSSMRDCPSPPLQHSGCPALFATCLLLLLLLLFIIQFVFFSFFLGWGSVCPGAMLIWPRVVCGSTACRLAHLVVCVSRACRSWHLAVWEPSWFLHLPWSGDAMHGLGVWRTWGFASSWWFFL
jgi:hypothetical protein